MAMLLRKRPNVSGPITGNAPTFTGKSYGVNDITEGQHQYDPRLGDETRLGNAAAALEASNADPRVRGALQDTADAGHRLAISQDITANPGDYVRPGRTSGGVAGIDGGGGFFRRIAPPAPVDDGLGEYRAGAPARQANAAQVLAAAEGRPMGMKPSMLARQPIARPGGGAEHVAPPLPSLTAGTMLEPAAPAAAVAAPAPAAQPSARSSFFARKAATQENDLSPMEGGTPMGTGQRDDERPSEYAGRLSMIRRTAMSPRNQAQMARNENLALEGNRINAPVQAAEAVANGRQAMVESTNASQERRTMLQAGATRYSADQNLAGQKDRAQATRDAATTNAGKPATPGKADHTADLAELRTNGTTLAGLYEQKANSFKEDPNIDAQIEKINARNAEILKGMRGQGGTGGAAAGGDPFAGAPAGKAEGDLLRKGGKEVAKWVGGKWQPL